MWFSDLFRERVFGCSLAGDLPVLAGDPCNDLLVDAESRADVGNFSFDLCAEPARHLLDACGCGRLGTPRAADLMFPNGMVMTPDGRALFICTAPGVGSGPARLQQGRIDFTRVDVPHAGRP